MKTFISSLAVLVAALMLHGCGQSDAAVTEHNLGRLYTENPAAAIPPQCYTRTRNSKGAASNPCYVCHTQSDKPNYSDDADLQLSYSFPAPALTNHWKNIFTDNSAREATISDDQILRYVRKSNYLQDGRIPLAQTLRHDLPSWWDGNRNGRWDGYVPDAWFSFDRQGFDRGPDGQLSGWRVLAYYPFPGTFFPTNGAMDDVMIRLPEIYRNNEAGRPDLSVYKVNLAIVEALIKRTDIAIDPVDEKALHVDLDGDGQLALARRVHFVWAPREGRTLHYVGQARTAGADEAPMIAGLYPLGTEFLHSVRYLDVDAHGYVHMAARMKELRYARKTGWVNEFQLRELASKDAKEEHDFPDRVEGAVGDIEVGVSNRRGWRYSGFIESGDGSLRPQSWEELSSCVGCHGGIGATTDGSFAFPRKLDSARHYRRGWYHWSQKSFTDLEEPRRHDGSGEYAYYLQQVGGGDEFRANQEVRDRFFDAGGALKPQMLERLREDISVLLMPSPSRALALDKAYRVLVQQQSFARGRTPVPGSNAQVVEQVEEGQRTGIRESLRYR